MIQHRVDGETLILLIALFALWSSSWARNSGVGEKGGDCWWQIFLRLLHSWAITANISAVAVSLWFTVAGLSVARWDHNGIRREDFSVCHNDA